MIFSKKLSQTYCFWARAAEVAILVLLLDQIPQYESVCAMMSRACWGVSASLTYHLIFFLLPWRGNFKYVRSALAVVRPWACFSLLLGAFSGALSTYYCFFGGCPILRDICFLGAVPCLLYALAWWHGESGTCDLYPETRRRVATA
ncbi:unnamed protein product [Amoebophrya sp. A120]|nr:unnamed protein product [Amoebophrya sp. A120]|eukprot:GSA120T00011258001.1